MKRHWWSMGAAVVLCFAAEAGAQEAPDETAKNVARTLAETGRRRFRAGDYAGALEALRDAEKYYRAPTISRLRAQAHEKLGQLVEARDVYRQVASEELPEGAPPEFVAAREEAMRALLSLRARIPRVHIVVENAPDGTRVTLDGKPLDAAALVRPIRLNPGKHVVAVEPPGAARITREIDVAERDEEKVEVVLAPATPRPPVTARPVTTPAARPSAPAMASPRGGQSFVGPAIAFGTGAVALVTGAVAGAHSLVVAEEIRSECGEELVCQPRHRERVETAKTLGHVSTVAFALAGAGIVTGTILLLVPGEKAAPARMSLVAGPTFLGLKGAF